MPDYTMKTKEIYREFTLRCLHDDPSLFILSTVEDRVLYQEVDLPSWVPDFGTPQIHTSLQYPGLNVSIPYAASGENTKPEIKWSVDKPDVISCQGYILDCISRGLGGELSFDLEDTARRAVGLLDSGNDVYVTGESKYEALWRTLIADTNHGDGYFYPADFNNADAFANLLVPFEETDRPQFEEDLPNVEVLKIEDQVSPGTSDNPQDSSTGHGEPESSQTDAESSITENEYESESESESQSVSSGFVDLAWLVKARFEHSMRQALRGRKFFITSKGYFGIGPSGLQHTDNICILSGGRLPYIIRQNGTPGEGMFTFIGECYVHGLCQGQALDFEGFLWRDIHLL
jgi:hypothetical protein